MENSTPCKYKTVKDIEKPAGIYHYVAESSCFAKFYRNRLTHFWWAMEEVFNSASENVRPSTRPVMETGHPSTRAVNSGRQLGQ